MVENTGARLIAEEGALSGTVLALDGADEWVMGRDPDECRIVVEDPLVSRRHALYKLNSEGGITIENLSQTNPIKVNDEDLVGPRLLEEGDQIRMGSSAFRFYSTTPQIDTFIPEEVTGTDAESSADKKMKRHLTFFEGEKAPAITEEDLFSNFGIDLDTGNRWMVKIISGPNAGAEYSLQPGRTYVVGNDASSCEIVLLDASVSRKHARLTIGEDQKVFLEDLKSRNGTLLDGETIQKKTPLEANQLISLGTSTMVLIDREGERSTIVSPPLGMLGKVLLNQEAIQAAAQTAVEKAASEKKIEPVKVEEQKKEDQPKVEEPILSDRSALFFKIGVVALLVLGTLGITTLFRSSDVQVNRVDESETIAKMLAPFPKVKWSFTRSTGVLLLLGHVSTAAERSQLLFNLQGLSFITRLDDQIVVDEYVWQETNLILSKNPNWRSVTLQAPEPGHFVLTGYLKTLREANLLNDYMSVNFRYLDLLDNRVVVEDSILREIEVRLSERQLTDVKVTMSSGEVTLTGAVPTDKIAAYQDLLAEIKDMQGVRAARNYVVEVGNQEAYIDLSNDYNVTGFSEVGDTTVDVVIDGRILAKGDILNGMKITDIKRGVIYLEKQGFKYKIIFKK